MRALDVKLARDLRRLWSQCLAIAAVLAAGVALLVLAFGAQASLFETRATYYERHRFADVFAAATRVPAHVAAEVAAIPGVVWAEPRIGAFAVLDLGPGTRPAMGRVLSLPASGAPALNLPFLRSGRLPDPLRPDEAAVSEAFALANGLRPGDRVVALLNGTRRTLSITGIALSPEFIYALGPGAMMPDDRSFGVIWIGEAAAAAAFDLRGAFNEVTLRLARGAAEPQVIAALDRLLEPYGGTGAHGRDRQVSHSFLDNELHQLRAASLILPPVFLGVAAFLVNMVLARLIALERQEIGLLKAVGYTDAAVAWHYLKLALAIGLVGILAGWGLGWWAGRGMTRLYADFFRFPFLIYLMRPEPFAISALAASAAVVLGALRAVGAAVALRPAVAMAPPMPARYRRSAVDALARALGLQQTGTMILRGIRRWPGRSLVTVAGVAASIATLIGALFTFDAVERLVDQSLYQSNRQDASLTLTEARTPAVLDDIARLPGVLAVEGAEMVPVRLRHGHRTRLASLEGRAPGAELARVLDERGRAVEPPDWGVLLSDNLAARLGLAPGMTVEVELLEGTRETLRLPVAGLVEQFYGEGAYMAAEALARALHRGPQVDVAHLLLDPSAQAELDAAVKATPGISGLILWTDVRRIFQETMGQNLAIVIGVYSTLGALIAVGVVYNAARIQLSERAHELASLRVLGFTRAEVSFVLVGELMLLTLVAVPLGWAAGYAFAGLVARAYSSDLITVPPVVGRGTVGHATLVVVGAALASALVVRRRLDRLDLVAVLKTRE